jgi:hypothetical protein
MGPGDLDRRDPVDGVFHALLLSYRSGSILPGSWCQRIDGEDPDIILVVGMEVRAMMWGSGLGEHADDDPEEAGKFGHGTRLCGAIVPRSTSRV